MRRAPGATSRATTAWLGQTDDTDPAEWLVQRAAAHGRTLGSADRADLAVRLIEAGKRFGETPRMIANRASQLEALLDESQIYEPAEGIIPAFLGVADRAGRVEGFGALAQHYANLRTAGRNRADALAELTRRYSPKL